MKLDLTKKEREALMHRLTVPDAICDALTDDSEGPAYHEVDVVSIIDKLPDQLDEAMAESEGITKAVLIDCIDGSTYVGCCETPSQERAHYKTLENLAHKIEDLFGVERNSISVPTC